MTPLVQSDAQVHAPVAELAHARPDLLIGCAQQFEDMQQLLQLTVSREQRRLRANSAPSMVSLAAQEQDTVGIGHQNSVPSLL